MSTKVTNIHEVERLFTDGMTIGIGGWGSRRKPMALLWALVRSGVKDLTIVSFGGPDVGILCATGQVRTAIFGFVSLDTIAIDPHFATARQDGSIATQELDEAMLVSGLRAAGRRLPFEVTRSGLGSDALASNPSIQTIVSPYNDREELVAMPAIPLDIALVHLSSSDEVGTAQCFGPDPYFDDLFALAAKRTILSVEEVVDRDALATANSGVGFLNQTMVDHVVLAPRGARFTAFPPHYERDEEGQRRYAASAGSTDLWRTFLYQHSDGGASA